MDNYISTKQAAKLIHRSNKNASTLLQRVGLKPDTTLGKYRWLREEVERLVAEKPELQRPYQPLPCNPIVSANKQPARPRTPDENETIIQTARRRIANGVRVGDVERYDLPYPAPGDVDPIGAVILAFIDEGDRKWKMEGGDA